MVPKKQRRPWNRVAQQVYSVSSVNREGVINMNIATYITPITMTPKQYMVGVYRDTQTHTNIFKSNRPFILQLFGTAHMHLVRPLGKKSGQSYDKAGYLSRRAILTQTEHGAYITDVPVALLLTPTQYISVGDHDIVVAEVTTILSQSDMPLLTTAHLQDAGIIA